MTLFYKPNWRDPETKLDGLYSLDYRELREDYKRYVLFSDDDFLDNIIDVLHFAVITCYLKHKSGNVVLADDGVIHELVHLLCSERNAIRGDPQPQVSSNSLQTIRDLFNRECCLAE